MNGNGEMQSEKGRVTASQVLERQPGIDIKAILAGIGVLILFSFLAGGYESFYQGIEAGRQVQPVQDGAGVGQAAQRELMRVADRPFGVAMLFLAIMLVGICAAGFLSGWIAKQSPVRNAAIVGALYAAFVSLGFIVLLLWFDTDVASLLGDGLQIVLAVPLAALGGYLSSLPRRHSP